MRRYKIGAIDKKTVLILAAAGAAIYFLMRKKKKGYSIEVPEPEKITEQQYSESSQPAGSGGSAPISSPRELATLPQRTPLTTTAKLYSPGAIHLATAKIIKPIVKKKKAAAKKKIGFPSVY